MSKDGPEETSGSTFGQRVMTYFGLGPDVASTPVSTKGSWRSLMAIGVGLAVGVLLWTLISAEAGSTFLVIGVVTLIGRPATHRALAWWDSHNSG
jgi:hypothetical protein